VTAIESISAEQRPKEAVGAGVGEEARHHHRRFQAETPLIALCRFAGPALDGLVGSIPTPAIVLLFWPMIDKAFGSVGRLWRPPKVSG
jgi:hypothetical protein